MRSETSFEVIVIDNASKDESPDMVETEFPWVRLYRMKENLGFTRGHNFALKERKAPHAFLLNSDTIVHPGTLNTILQYHATHSEAGIIGPKLLNSDGSLQYSCRHFPNPTAALFRNTPLGKLFPNNRFTRDYLMTDWPHNQEREVDWVSGAAFFASSELIEHVGVFDEGFGMYCEDVDWCYRAWQNGFKVVYLPTGVVTHAIGKSTDQVANRMIIRFHRSMLRFYRKNMLKKTWLPLRPFTYLVAGAALTLRALIPITKNLRDEAIRRVFHR
jgi:GT2 family glycosyltransferase